MDKIKEEAKIRAKHSMSLKDVGNVHEIMDKKKFIKTWLPHKTLFSGTDITENGDFTRDLDRFEQHVKDECAKKYNELMMAVVCKFSNESRHQTALRYIQERENQEVAPAKAIEEKR